MQKKRAGKNYTFAALIINSCYNFVALLAMKGLMLQEELTIDDALKIMDLGQRQPNRMAPALPPKVLREYR